MVRIRQCCTLDKPDRLSKAGWSGEQGHGSSKKKTDLSNSE